jgi:hypothetical protein
VQGGSASDGNGGAANLLGRNASGTTRTGGAVTITAGNSTTAVTGGVVTITAGTGGGSDGAGGACTIAGGAGGATNGNGGNLVLRAGNAAGSGTDGIAQLGVTNTSAITLGATGITTTNAGPLLTSEGIIRHSTSIGAGGDTLDGTDDIVLCSATNTITLPASPTTGQTYVIKSAGAAVTVTIARNGKNIDGAAADKTLTALQTGTLYYDGSAWWTIAN